MLNLLQPKPNLDFFMKINSFIHFFQMDFFFSENKIFSRSAFAVLLRPKNPNDIHLLYFKVDFLVHFDRH